MTKPTLMKKMVLAVDNSMDPHLIVEKSPFHPLLWKVMLIAGVFIYASYTILVHLCEEDGKIPFSSASVVLLIEIIKLCLSLWMLMVQVREKGFQLPPVGFVLPFAVPAVLYCINNNIAVHMQLQMDPATYQVLGNLKILSTAFLYRIIIKKYFSARQWLAVAVLAFSGLCCRPITVVQWVALSLLAIAGACNSYGGLHAKPNTHSAGEIHITLTGLVMICAYCFISGLSGVYTEYILKRKYEISLHLQNSLLYIFGIILNGSVWFIGALRSPNSDVDFNLFRGYTFYTWILIISQALNGLIMSAIMKHGSNITRLFLISCAMLVTTGLSMLIFHLHLNIYFCFAFLLVIMALYLYHRT